MALTQIFASQKLLLCWERYTTFQTVIVSFSFFYLSTLGESVKSTSGSAGFGEKKEFFL